MKQKKAGENMLHIVIGPDWTACTDEIMRRISLDVQAKRENLILLVPELISHETERRLCCTAGDTASRFAEVLSFTRLVRRVSDELGNVVQECLDNGGRMVAMAAATRQLHSRLKAYAAVETRPEFLSGLVDAVDEFKRCCITADDLKSASLQTEGSLAQKLEELALILEAYDSLCHQGKRDPRDQETLLLEQMEEGDFGRNHVFYIDGFPDFTRQHLAILEHIIRVCPEVTISFTCDSLNSGKLAFEKAADTAAQVLRCARRAEIPVDIQVMDANPSPLAEVKAHLFQGPLQSGEAKNALHVIRAEHAYGECQGAAERILELVRSGCRYRDISVVCTDMEVYRPLVSLVFHRCGIPLYVTGTEDILNKNVVSMILAAMDAALGGFDQREVVRYLRAVLSPLDPDTCDLLENYAVVWGIRGDRWLQPWQNHPDGLSGEWTADTEVLLERLNAARAAAMEPLEHLRRGFYSASNLGQQVRALYAFLEDIHLQVRLEQLAQQLQDAGDLRSAQILNQLWEIILGAMEQLYDVLGNTYWDAETFTRLFRLLLGRYDVGTIPPVLDAVQMGPVTAMRCLRHKHLIVIGAQEGNLPGYSGSVGVLTDQERDMLRAMGVPLTGGSMEGIQAEFAEIYGVFCGASETAAIFYSGQPSFVTRRLAEMAGGEDNCSNFLGAAQTGRFEAGAYFAKWKDEEAAERAGVCDAYQDVLCRCDYSLGTVQRESIESLYGKKLYLSASQIDRQAECRLSYFLKYGLRTKERKEAKVDPAEFGTYVHAVLEETARTVMERGGFAKVSLEETMEIADHYSDAYIAAHFSQLDSERIAYLFRRNAQELSVVVAELWEELREAKFQPVGFEVNFGGEQGLPAIPVSGKRMDAVLRGFVDRVDAWQQSEQNYYRVVDYKTGRKDFDYCDVWCGVGLQMLLYLFAMEENAGDLLGNHPIPAGVQYFPARVPYLSCDGPADEAELVKEREKLWKRKGLLLHDMEVLQAMEPGDAPHRLCCAYKKDGSVSGDLADRDQLKLLRAYIFKLIGNMVDDIASGNVEPNPYTRGNSHSACAFCPYGSICHEQEVVGRRNYKAMNAQRFWEEIRKEMHHD